MTWAFEIQFVGSALCGLIAFWAIQDDSDRRRVVLAAAMLALGTLFSSLGLPFAAGVAAELAWRRRWRLLWVPALTVVMYGLWYIGYGIDAHATRAGPIDAVWWGLRCAVAGLAGTFGLPQAWGWPLLAGFAGLVAWRLPKTGVTPRFVGLAATGVIYWCLVGMGRADSVPYLAPDSSRYLLVGIIVFVLLACELLNGIEVRRPELVATVAVAVIAASAVLGFVNMNADANQRREVVSTTYAELTALKLVAGAARRDYIVDGLLAPEILAGPYLDSASSTASVDLPNAPEPARMGADRVLREVSVKLKALPAAGGLTRCLRVPAHRELAVSSGASLKLFALRPLTALSLRRFGDQRAFMGPVTTGGTLFTTVADKARTPYRIAFSSPVRVCR
jgi:hypothetical protein